MKRQDAERVVGAITKAVLGLVTDDAGRATSPKMVDPPISAFKQDDPKLGDLELPDGHGGKVKLTAAVLEAIYRAFRNRMIDELRVDPVFVKLLASQPEIEVALEPRVIEIEGSTLKGRISRLLAGGFLDEAKGSGAVKKELMRTGTEPNGGNLATALSDFVAMGFLTREGDGFRKAPGLKITERRIET